MRTEYTAMLGRKDRCLKGNFLAVRLQGVPVEFLGTQKMVRKGSTVDG